MIFVFERTATLYTMEAVEGCEMIADCFYLHSRPQTFLPENIVMLSDGFCGSTCAIFSELLKTQAGTQSIAVGGRKQNGPMQSVGGSKGSNDQALADLVRTAQKAYSKAVGDERDAFEPFVKAGLFKTAKQVVSLLLRSIA